MFPVRFSDPILSLLEYRYLNQMFYRICILEPSQSLQQNYNTVWKIFTSYLTKLDLDSDLSVENQEKLFVSLDILVYQNSVDILIGLLDQAAKNWHEAYSEQKSATIYLLRYLENRFSIHHIPLFLQAVP